MSSEKSIRVLHLALESTSGGIESFLFNLEQNLNHDVVSCDYVAFTEHPAFEAELKASGAQIHIVKHRKNPIKYWRQISYILNTNSYDCVHIHKNTAMDFIPFLCAKTHGIKSIICHSHNTNPGLHGIKLALHRLGRHVISATCTDKLACSKAAGQWLYRSGENYRVINNGIDIASLSFCQKSRTKIREELEGSDSILIGAIGRLTAQKNHSFLIDTTAHIIAKHPNAKLVIVGEGPLHNDLSNKVEKRGLIGNVIFTGNVLNVTEYMSAFDVLAMPSLFEGLPIVAIEAQANGLPCVLSTRITNESAINDNVYLLDLEDGPEAWSDAIITAALSAHPGTISDGLRKYDIRETADNLLEIYGASKGKHD